MHQGSTWKITISAHHTVKEEVAAVEAKVASEDINTDLNYKLIRTKNID